jgi:hypothetical protein
MAQIGMNMGARHARTLGWAKSYVKNLDEETRVAHDEDLIGVMSLAWSLIKSNIPAEIVDEAIDFLNEHNYPQMGTRLIPSGLFEILVYLFCHTYLFFRVRFLCQIPG